MPDDATLVLPRSGTSIKIGRVVSVSGAQIIALIRDPRSNGEHPAARWSRSTPPTPSCSAW